MEGGMIEATIKQMRRIYMEEGRREVRQRRKQIIEEERQRINKKIEIERQKFELKLKIMERELIRRGINYKDIEEARKKAEQRMEKIKNI